MSFADQNSFDLNAKGFHEGFVEFMNPSNRSAYGRCRVPIATYNSQTNGKTLFLGAGSHGDEYEGQILLRLLIGQLRARVIKPVSGRIIVMPSMNLPACLASTRFSPIDHGNLNANFVTQPYNLTSAIGAYITQTILPLSDVFFDIHSGGTSLDYTPTALCFVDEAGKISEEKTKLLKISAFPHLMLRQGPNVPSFAFHAAEKQNCTYLSAELGGRAGIDHTALRVGWRALKSFLAALEILRPQTQKNKAKQIWTSVFTSDSQLVSSGNGVFHSSLKLRKSVKKGGVAGKFYALDRNGKPETLRVPSEGIVMAKRPLALCEPGDCLAEIGCRIPAL